MAFIITLFVTIVVIVWLRRQRRGPELVDNVAYASHNADNITSQATDITTTPNEAYETSSVVTSTNASGLGYDYIWSE